MRALLNFCRLMTHRNYPGVWRERQKKKGGGIPTAISIPSAGSNLISHFREIYASREVWPICSGLVN